MGDGSSLQGYNNYKDICNGDGGNAKNAEAKKKNNKKKKSSNKKKKMTLEQNVAAKAVREWVFLDSFSASADSSFDGFGPQKGSGCVADKVVFELHSHSKCSDGFLSPTALVERAHRKGVKVLALTDHDTMSGIPEALEAAHKFGMKIIPGVEISTIFAPRGESGAMEPVHILAYFSGCGPSGIEELENCLAIIRDGRYLRAKKILSKLNNLKVPLKWEHVTRIAGNGVAPGRLHVARAMVEAGHVENLKQAFNRYLYDDGPAYSMGSEPLSEEAVKLICQTGGVAVLAHPWALKNPVAVIRRLKDAGLHGIEVYRSDGKLAAFSDLADAYGLLKLGGSDYHGRGGHDESELGSASLPVVAVRDFLKVARPIWCSAIKDLLQRYADEPSDSNLERIARFGKSSNLKGSSTFSWGKDVIDLCLSSWLTNEEWQSIEFETLRLQLSRTVLNQGGVHVSVLGR